MLYSIPTARELLVYVPEFGLHVNWVCCTRKLLLITRMPICGLNQTARLINLSDKSTLGFHAWSATKHDGVYSDVTPAIFIYLFFGGKEKESNKRNKMPFYLSWRKTQTKGLEGKPSLTCTNLSRIHTIYVSLPNISYVTKSERKYPLINKNSNALVERHTLFPSPSNATPMPCPLQGIQAVLPF